MDGRTLQAALFALDSAARAERENNTIRPRDLKRSVVPSKRPRHSDRVQWRGSQGQRSIVKAIYEVPNEHNMARVAKPGTRFTDSPENRSHSHGSFRAC